LYFSWISWRFYFDGKNRAGFKPGFKNPAAKQFFESLSYSKQRVHAESVASAKTPETLQRRIDKSISELNAGKK